MFLDERRPVDERAFIELTLVNVEVLGSLAAIVKRLEAVPDTPPMDDARAAMVHSRKTGCTTARRPTFGEQKRNYFPNFDHPDPQTTGSRGRAITPRRDPGRAALPGGSGRVGFLRKRTPLSPPWPCTGTRGRMAHPRPSGATPQWHHYHRGRDPPVRYPNGERIGIGALTSSPTRPTWRDWVGPNAPEQAEMLTRNQLFTDLRADDSTSPTPQSHCGNDAGYSPYPTQRRENTTTTGYYPVWMADLVRELRRLQGEGLKLEQITQHLGTGEAIPATGGGVGCGHLPPTSEQAYESSPRVPRPSWHRQTSAQWRRARAEIYGHDSAPRLPRSSFASPTSAATSRSPSTFNRRNRSTMFSRCTANMVLCCVATSGFVASSDAGDPEETTAWTS